MTHDTKTLHPTYAPLEPTLSVIHLLEHVLPSENISPLQALPPTLGNSQHQMFDPGENRLVKATTRILKKGPAALNYPKVPICIHIDGGANRSITNDITILHNFKYIKKYPMNGVNGDAPALYCKGVGLLPWKAPTGDTLLLKCYYSAEAAKTIISPTDAVITSNTDFNTWTQYSNLDTGRGYVQFHRRTGPTVVHPLLATNGLWYMDNQGCTIADYQDIAAKPTMRKLTNAACMNYTPSV